MCLIIINIVKYLCILMNEIGSLFLATLVLAVGGMGLYIYKTSDLDEQNGGNNENIEEDEYSEENDDYEPEIVEVKTRVSKSKKNRRKAVGTKRRYY